MNLDELFQLTGSSGAALADDVKLLLPRALLALIVGSLLAWRPWRAWLGLPPVKSDMAQAQALLCVAGCVMVCVVGDSVARAFGLVGLGGLIRFRAALKDPRDGAIFFLVIGLGMAAGIGAFALVISGGAFVMAVLAVLEKTWPGPRKAANRMRLFVRCDSPRETEQVLRPALALASVNVRESTVDEVEHTLELLVDEPGPGVLATAVAGAPVRVRSMRCELLKEE